MTETKLISKPRKPLDLELKRTIENEVRKSRVSLGLAERTVKTLDSEHKKNFRTCGNTTEYFLVKGFESQEPCKVDLGKREIKIYISINLAATTLRKLKETAQACNCKVSDMAEFYLNVGFRAEGLI